MTESQIRPDYIFEVSWEVCNLVGGIYTVLSTKAKTLQKSNKDKVVFIGPDVWQDKPSPYFIEDNKVTKGWLEQARLPYGLKVRTGRWDIPGNPIVVLVDFKPLYDHKNELYRLMWDLYGVDSMPAYGDYDEASAFAWASALVIENYYLYINGKEKNVVAHFNEWTTAMGMLYLKHFIPGIATLFTTHATSMGRSIAGNNKPLYDYLWAYNGDQMAEELNVQSKHSIEKQTAFGVDCFTTVSEITARECKELIGRPVDVVLPNGFENDFVPKGAAFTRKRKAARKKLLQIANCLTGAQFDDNTLIIGTSGRYEFRNKGIDEFVEAMNRLNRDERLSKPVVAFVEVPAWVGDAREDLKKRIDSGKTFDTPLEVPMVTHWLHNMDKDNVLSMMKYNDMENRKEDRVKLIFLPCYLTGNDGIVNLNYFDVIIGKDLSAYPSYYEPWGYTPLESVAFKVPCITTDLAGFGLWANSVKGSYSELEDGVKTIHRTDYNFSEVADTIKDTVSKFSNMTDAEIKKARTAADKLSKKALWSEFIKYYWQAYDFALQKVK